MFPIFLFVVVFCFYNWLAYDESQLMSSQQRLEFAATKTTPPVQSTVASPGLFDNKGEVPEIPITEAVKEPFIALAPNDKLVLNEIASLKLRTARKVANKLGITQKLNGTDKSLDCLQQEISQQLHSDYGQVVLALELAKVS